MIRLSLLISALLIGLGMTIAKNDVKFSNIFQKQFSRNNEQVRTLRNLMGKLMDTDTNTIYTVDGQKEQDKIVSSAATAPPTAQLTLNALPSNEQIACLAACHSCVEDYSLEIRKKRAADNCGPMCDCADSCFLMPIEQVRQIYGQYSNTLNDKDCWWRTYTEMFSNELPSSI